MSYILNDKPALFTCFKDFNFVWKKHNTKALKQLVEMENYYANFLQVLVLKYFYIISSADNL